MGLFEIQPEQAGEEDAAKEETSHRSSSRKVGSGAWRGRSARLLAGPPRFWSVRDINKGGSHCQEKKRRRERRSPREEREEPSGDPEGIEADEEVFAPERQAEKTREGLVEARSEFFGEVERLKGECREAGVDRCD